MNPASDAPSLPAAAGPATATDVDRQRESWSGLAVESGRLGVPLDEVALTRFEKYRDLLLTWNSRLNLTAVRDPQEIERRLILDALAMVPVVDRAVLSVRPQRSRAPRLIDVGSGAGVPGLALKIARPVLDVTLVDATAKKVMFLDEAIAELELPGTKAVHGRAEELGQEAAFRERFDLATARAVAALPVLLEYVAPLLTMGGTALLPKGLSIADELRAGRRAAAMLGAEIVSADELPPGGTRLVVVRKSGKTPAAYPRRIGLPSRSPLGEGS